MKGRGNNLLTAVFKHRKEAEKAYNDLLEAGYKDSEIHLMMSDKTHQQHSEEQIDGVESTVISSIAALGTLVPVPGIGLALSGPLAASIVEDGAEGLPEDLIPALIGFGLPVEYAREYESAIRGGDIMLGFRPHSTEDAERFALQWSDLKAKYLYQQALS